MYILTTLVNAVLERLTRRPWAIPGDRLQLIRSVSGWRGRGSRPLFFAFAQERIMP